MMANLIVAFPDRKNAMAIRAVLQRSGYNVNFVCTSGTSVKQAADRLNSGIIVCGYRFRDMPFEDLYENIPDTFGILLVAPNLPGVMESHDNVLVLTLPIKVGDLVGAVDQLIGMTEERNRIFHRRSHQRSEEDKTAIFHAKELLMQKNEMSEQEAHRYLQKTSMNSGYGLVETARMIIDLMEG